MTSYERFNAAFAHKEADRVPIDVGAGKSCKMVLGFYKKLLDYLGIREEIQMSNTVSQLVYASDKVLEALGCDIRCVNLGSGNPNTVPETWEDEKYYYMRDSFLTGFRKPKKDGLYFDMCEFPLSYEDEEGDDKYEFPHPPAPDKANMSREQAIDYHKAGFPVVISEHHGNGFLQTGPRLYGYEDWMVMLMTEEERVKKLLERYIETKFEYWENLLDYYGAENIDMIAECDDLGTQATLFASPKTMRELIFPYHKQLYSRLKSKYGVKVCLHSCGSIAPIIGDLIDCGVDALNPVQTTANNMDPAMLKREFGKDIVFWGGGIETQSTLPFGTPEKIKDAVKRNIELLGRDGGYVFAAIHNIQPDVPMENFEAMMDAALNFKF